MKISEAKSLYRTQINEYQEQKNIISEQQKKLKKQMEADSDNAHIYEQDAALLQKTFDELDKKQQEYYDYMEQLSEKWCAYANAESSRQQGDAMADYAKDMAKIMEVARRIMKGARVPETDEKKLMDFDPKLYQMAKNIGMMRVNREKKDYKSLWEDEEKKEYPDPLEYADSMEAPSDAPETVEAGELSE